MNSNGKIPSTGKILLRGGSNPGRCITQDREPNTLPMSYSSQTHLVRLLPYFREVRPLLGSDHHQLHLLKGWARPHLRLERRRVLGHWGTCQSNRQTIVVGQRHQLHLLKGRARPHLRLERRCVLGHWGTCQSNRQTIVVGQRHQLHLFKGRARPHLRLERRCVLRHWGTCQSNRHTIV